MHIYLKRGKRETLVEKQMQVLASARFAGVLNVDISLRPTVTSVDISSVAPACWRWSYTATRMSLLGSTTDGPVHVLQRDVRSVHSC